MHAKLNREIPGFEKKGSLDTTPAKIEPGSRELNLNSGIGEFFGRIHYL